MECPVLFGELVARSPAMLRIFRLVDSLYDSQCPVLLVGEPGVGKDALARAIHQRSSRWAHAYVRMNCAALPAAPLDREGFEQRVAVAEGGTLVLTEVAALPLSLQRRLVEILQSEGRPRVIATTSVPLSAEVADGTMLTELADLLQALAIAVPPLRERHEDIEPLALQLLARIGTSRGRALRFTPGAMQALIEYSWPANIGELLRAIEYAIAVSEGHAIEPHDLPETLGALPAPRSDATATVRSILAPDPTRNRTDLLATLEAHHWRRGQAARALGISRATLWRRMRDAGL